MKKISIALICALVLFGSHYLYSAMKDFSEFDGYNWIEYHEFVKAGLALGFLMGVHKAIEALGPSKEKADEALPVYNVTNTQLKEELDKFYDDPGNRSVTIENAAIIVLKQMSPKKDVKILERETEIAKLPAEEQRIERIKDIIKEDIKTGQYEAFELKDEEVIEKKTGKPVSLETEKEVTKVRFEMLAPGAVVTKEVEKVSYAPAIIVGIVAIIAIGVIVFIMRKKRKNE